MSEILFSHISRFSEIDKTKFEEILSFFEIKKVKKKAILMSEGTHCKSHFFVLEGCLHMHFSNSKGAEQTVQFAIENWWLTDYSAYHTQAISEYNISAVEDSLIAVIDHNKQESLLNKYPELEKYFRVVYQIAYGAALNRVKYIFNYSKEEIFFIFRDHHPDFVNRVPQYMVATYLGLTPEYLSQLRKKTVS